MGSIYNWRDMTKKLMKKQTFQPQLWINNLIIMKIIFPKQENQMMVQIYLIQLRQKNKYLEIIILRSVYLKMIKSKTLIKMSNFCKFREPFKNINDSIYINIYI